MRECHAVLLGPSALRFILDIGPIPGSFTFCVSHAQSHRFLHYLLVRCSFRMQRDNHPGNNHGDYCQSSYRGRYPGIERLVYLRRTNAHGKLFVTVAVTGTEAHPGTASIPAALMSSTLMFNYMTADAIVIGYPTLTLHRRSLFHIERIAPCLAGPPLSTYARHGVDFRIRPDNWDKDADDRVRPCARSWLATCLRRSFGDKGCLVVSFNDGPVEAQGTGWVWGGLAACNVHGPRATRVHMPLCDC